LEIRSYCPECGAFWFDGNTCQDYFSQMLAWEYEDMEHRGLVHHLMVLCYHLQHPSLFSPQGLSFGKELLRKFVRDGIKPHEIRMQLADEVNSSRRHWKPSRSSGPAGRHLLSLQQKLTGYTGGGRIRISHSSYLSHARMTV
jgi:hypothetical protein